MVASNEIVLVDNFIKAAQDQRDNPLSDDVAFEAFSSQSVLRDRNLSDEEIESGIVGGGMDGGIDSVHVFLDGALLNEDSEVISEGFVAGSVRKSCLLYTSDAADDLTRVDLG